MIHFLFGDCNSSKTNMAQKKPFVHGFNVFPKSGWVFVKESISGLSMVSQSNFNSFGHYQQHETSFILKIKNYDLIIDPGIFSYNKTSPFYSFMSKSSAHNVLLIDDHEFNSQKSNFGLSGITRWYVENSDQTGNNGVVEITHPHYNNINVHFFRQLSYMGNNTLIIRDIVDSPEKHHC